MKIFDTKKIFVSLILFSIFAGSLFMFCQGFGMQMEDLMQADSGMHAMGTNCAGNPSQCPQIVSNNFRDLLSKSPVAQKVLLLVPMILLVFYLGKSAITQAEKLLSFRFNKEYIPPNYLALAFARGILNSKIYNA